MSSLALVFCLSIFAQKEGKHVQQVKIKEQKIAYCTEKAGLDSRQAPIYWKLRDLVDAEKKSIKQSAPKLMKLDLDVLTEEEVKAALQEISAAHAAADQLEADYLDQFIKAVTAKKLVKLKRAEKSFKREMLKDIRDGKLPPPPPPAPAKN